MREKRGKLNGFLIIGAGILMAYGIVFALEGFFPFGSGSVVALDLSNQYMPLLYRFYDVIKNGKNIAVDLNLGGGINIYSETITELLNPFNYFLLLFPREKLYLAVNLLVVLYALGASLSAYWVLNKLNENRNSTNSFNVKTCQLWDIGLAMAYGMSYYVAYQYEIIRWMYPVFLFPFFFMSLKNLLEGKKNYSFVLLLAYELVLSFQFGLQLCLFTFLWTACQLVSRSNCSNAAKKLSESTIKQLDSASKMPDSAPKRFGLVSKLFGSERKVNCLNGEKSSDTQQRGKSGRIVMRLGISVLSALLLSSFSTVPFLYNLFSSARKTQNSSVFTVVMHHGLDNILERFFEISSPIVIGTMLFSLLVLKKEIKIFLKENKGLCLTFGILVLTVILEPSNLLWHLGSYQCFPVRYGYIVLFLGILISRKLLFKVSENLRDNVKESKTIKGVGLFALPLIMVGFVYIYNNRLAFSQAFATLDISNVCLKETLVLYGIMLLITASVEWFLFATCFKNDIVVSAILYVLGAVLTGMIWDLAIFFPQSSPARQLNEAAYEDMNAGALYTESREYAGHLSEEENYPLNAALITGENSMSAYLPSGESLEYSQVMESLGFDTPWVTVSSREGNEDARYILGINGGLEGGILLSKSEVEAVKNVNDLKLLARDENTVKLDFNYNRGTVTARISEGRYGGETYSLLLPMAYIDGWKSSNGSISSYLGGFLRLDIEDITEKVEISFTPPGMALGIGLSVLGLGIMIIAGVIFAQTAQSSASSIAFAPLAAFAEKTALYIFAFLAILLALGIYILPNLGMAAFMGAKALGWDGSEFVLNLGKVDDDNESQEEAVLLDTQWEEEGLRVFVGHKDLMDSKRVKVTASDTEDSEFSPQKVRDNDTGEDSRWSSENNWDDNEHYLRVDLKENSSINAVKIYWERTNVTDYAIEISDNGKDWQELVHRNEAPSKNPETIFFDTAFVTRYIRIHTYEVAKNEEDLTLYYQNVSINELEIFQDPCDSFLIKYPELTEGYNREVPIPEVPEPYSLSIGGIDYDNLLNGNLLADTLSDVSAQIGYTLSYGDEKWNLPGFDVVIPSSDGENDTFPYESVDVKEFKSTGGMTDVEVGEFTEGMTDVEVDESKGGRMAAGENESTGEGTAGRDNDISGITYITTTDNDDASFLGDEGYEIEIKSDGSIIIKAKDEKGRNWALNTLERMREENPKEYPVGIIRDYPKYAVRGLCLDVARSPISMDMLYEIMTLMSENYMNTLQIHLNDNAIIASSQYDGSFEGAKELYSAFRLESKVKNEAGESLTAEDGYYTKEEFRQFIKDAKALGVDVVPEIDTPAHSLSITKCFPALGMTSDPDMADTLDISRSETLQFVTDLWMEYLTGDDSSADGAVFEDCSAISLGMDEFYGDYDDYAQYLSGLTENIRQIAPEKQIRIWGSMDYKEMDKNAIDPDTQIMIWNMYWADPKKTYEKGFSIINCLSQDLYIIVGGGYDYLDNEYLSSEWEPNTFIDGSLKEEIPAWSSKMLGACYSLWNDNNLGAEGASFEDGLYDRIERPVVILSRKLWD